MRHRLVARAGGAALFVALITAAGGCFNPDYGEGNLRCQPDDPNGPCPDGYRCIEFGEPGNFRCRSDASSTAQGPRIVRFEVLSRQVQVGGQLRAQVEVENFELDPGAVGREPVPGHGHLHVFVDDVRDKWEVVATPNFTLDVPLLIKPGPHGLVVQLFQNNHVAVNPPVVADAPFEVVIR